MSSSRAQRLLGLLNDDILALPKAPSPEPPPPVPTTEHHLTNDVTVQASRAWQGSPEPRTSDDQDISALAHALALDERAPSPSNSESSHEPDPHDEDRSPDLYPGDLAIWREESYVSIQVASKFPYKFVNRAYSDQVAKKFFDRNQFWNRDWDLYYLYPPDEIGSKPLILITLTQFQLLIHDINKYKRNLDFKLTDYHRDCGLIIDIPHPAFTPRFLGYSSSREEYNDMERRAPAAAFKAPGEPTLPSADKPTLEAFKAKIEEAIVLNKAKSKAAKAKRKEQRVTSQQNWGRLFKRTQRYLGLRPAQIDGYNPLADPGLDWAELQAAEAARKVAPLDTEKPVPYPFDKNAVFISVDIEAFELDNSKITEVGVATLDVLDIIDIPPGKDGKNWFDKIRARHFRIHEHAHLENYRHVAGCADGFEFGTSEFVRLADAPSAVASCFKPPFSADLSPAEAERLAAADGVSNLDPSIVNADGKRNLIFVGHDPNQDISYLHKLGYNPLNLSNLIEVPIDTKQLHQHWKRDTQGTSLGRILAELDIIGWKLHNGGNDAVYTMQALVALCVREASLRGTQELDELRKLDHQKRMTEAVAEVVAKVSDEADGWSSPEDDDGTAPVLARPTARLEPDGYIPPPGHNNPEASDCIFVGNLPYRATPEDVVAFFAKYGTISDVHLPINHITGATKGVGYISYKTPAEAKNAFDKCKGIEFWSRPIRVDMAPPREKKGGRNNNTGPGARSQRSSRSNTPLPRANPAAVRITDPMQNATYKTQQSSSTQPFSLRPAAQNQRHLSDHANGGGSEPGGVSVLEPPRQLTPQDLPDDWW